MDIKIFVSCHKKFKVLDNQILFPIQVGTYFNKPIENFLHDVSDEQGKDISNKNKKYCELTAQYYVWKNIDADYYGFFHYRRYLSFSNHKYKTKITNEIVVDDFDEEFAKRFGYDSDNMTKIISENDIILPTRSLAIPTVYGHYKLACTQDIKDLDFCIDYIKNHYPHMYKSAKKYLRGHQGYFCNMFIMKKDIFFKYSSWLFEILQAHEKFNSHELSDVQTYRVSGYLAERLFGIFITYLKSKNTYKIKELQIIKIVNPVLNNELLPEKNAKQTIVIPFDFQHMPKASVLLQSIVDSAKDRTEVILLHTKIEQEFINKLIYQGNDNVIIKNLELSANIKTYNQLLLELPKILNNYKKILLLKPFSICKNPLSFNLTEDNNIAGVIDVDEMLQICKNKKKLAKFITNPNYPISDNRLEIDLPRFAVNTKDLKSKVSLNDIFKMNKIQILPQKKMFKFDSYFIKNKAINSYLPHNLFEDYMFAKKNCELVNFDGPISPQTTPYSNFGLDFYEIATKTPFYSIILTNLINSKLSYKERKFIRKRKRLEKLTPAGSDLRLALRTISKKYY